MTMTITVSGLFGNSMLGTVQILQAPFINMLLSFFPESMLSKNAKGSSGDYSILSSQQTAALGGTELTAYEETHTTQNDTRL